MEIQEILKSQFNDHVAFFEKRPGILQVLAPLFHEDGDMVDVFIDMPKSENSPIRISDHGMSLMRLSYSYDIDTPTKRRILDRILSENGVKEDQGRLYTETSLQSVYPSLLQFAQTVAKVSNMQAFKREVVHSLFYETLGDFVKSNLSAYQPIEDYKPIATRDDLEVDWRLNMKPRNIFLYGVRDHAKAVLATLMCREFQIERIPFRSVIVHEDFENALSKKDQARITNAADKQFATFDDFKANAEQYFAREVDYQATV